MRRFVSHLHFSRACRPDETKGRASKSTASPCWRSKQTLTPPSGSCIGPTPNTRRSGRLLVRIWIWHRRSCFGELTVLLTWMKQHCRLRSVSYGSMRPTKALPQHVCGFYSEEADDQPLSWPTGVKPVLSQKINTLTHSADVNNYIRIGRGLWFVWPSGVDRSGSYGYLSQTLSRKRSLRLVAH